MVNPYPTGVNPGKLFLQSQQNRSLQEQNEAQNVHEHHLLSLFTIVTQIMLVVWPAVLKNSTIVPKASRHG